MNIIGQGTVSLFGLLGAIVILLWGVRMIRKGAEELLLPYINTASPVFHNRWYALLTGTGGAAALQSSTALVLIVSSISTKITVPLNIALAFVLGADIGTAIAAQLFTFNIKSIGPLLLLLGFLILRMTKKTQRFQHIGRIFMGFGFILYALTSISTISQSISSSAMLANMLSSALVNDIALALLVSIVLTWLSHSSLAMVLLTIELVASHIITLDLGISLVLGANIGACLPAYTDSIGLSVEARRLTLGNVIFRVSGGLIFIIFMHSLHRINDFVSLSPERFLAFFHLFFNVVLALLFIFFLSPIAKLIKAILPDPVNITDKGTATKFLRTDDISNPNLAITNLIKEVFRMSENVYVMVDHASRSLTNASSIPEIRRLEKVLDALYRSITRYLQKLYSHTLDEKQTFFAMLIHAYCTDLEQVGDIVESSMHDSLLRKHRKHIQIAPDYQKQLEHLFEKLKENIVVSQEIFRTQDLEQSNALIEGKALFKKEVVDLSLVHKRRTLEGDVDSVAINSIYLDIIHDLRRINAHVSGIAHLIIEYKDNSLIF